MTPMAPTMVEPMAATGMPAAAALFAGGAVPEGLEGADRVGVVMEVMVVEFEPLAPPEMEAPVEAALDDAGAELDGAAVV